MNFSGRRALVTGAGSGIGSQIVEQLLDAGATVAALDLDTDSIPTAALALTADVSRADQLAEAFATAESELGGLDLLFNNAGIGSTRSIEDVDIDEWERVFAVNVRGTYLGIKYAIPGMLARGYGAIVNTASVAGLVGLRERAAYCASKGAVIALTRQVAVQYAGTGVRCNCVCPGTVDSPWVGKLLDAAPDPATARSDLVARQPVGRLGRPAEIARAALYLASDDADFVTGSALVIDGGLTAA